MTRNTQHNYQSNNTARQQPRHLVPVVIADELLMSGVSIHGAAAAATTATLPRRSAGLLPSVPPRRAGKPLADSQRLRVASMRAEASEVLIPSSHICPTVLQPMVSAKSKAPHSAAVSCEL